jgi:hypothetical protein
MRGEVRIRQSEGKELEYLMHGFWKFTQVQFETDMPPPAMLFHGSKRPPF